MDADDTKNPAAAFVALQRARDLLAAGEGVAEPDWFDEAAEVVAEIDALSIAYSLRSSRRQVWGRRLTYYVRFVNATCAYLVAGYIAWRLFA